MRKRTTKLTSEQIVKLLERGNQIKIPVVGIVFPIGYDGDSFALRKTQYGWGEIYLKWWAYPPKTWQPLADWYCELRDFLKASLDENSN